MASQVTTAKAKNQRIIEKQNSYSQDTAVKTFSVTYSDHGHDLKGNTPEKDGLVTAKNAFKRYLSPMCPATLGCNINMLTNVFRRYHHTAPINPNAARSSRPISLMFANRSLSASPDMMLMMYLLYLTKKRPLCKAPRKCRTKRKEKKGEEHSNIYHSVDMIRPSGTYTP